MIRQHLCQYTTLRHETDMFNQSVSTTSAHFQNYYFNAKWRNCHFSKNSSLNLVKLYWIIACVLHERAPKLRLLSHIINSTTPAEGAELYWLWKMDKWGVIWPLLYKGYSRLYCDSSTDCSSCFVQTMEPVDQLLQCVDPTKDRELWVRENKTGEVRPVDIEIWRLFPHWSRSYMPEDWLKSVRRSLLTPKRLMGISQQHILRASCRGRRQHSRGNPEWWMKVSDGDRSQWCPAQVAQEVWIGRQMIRKHHQWTFNTCKCWPALCHAAV